MSTQLLQNAAGVPLSASEAAYLSHLNWRSYDYPRFREPSDGEPSDEEGGGSSSDGSES